MVIKTVSYFVDSNLVVEISSIKRGYQKREGEFWKLFFLGGGQMTYLGKGRICLVDQM